MLVSTHVKELERMVKTVELKAGLLGEVFVYTVPSTSSTIGFKAAFVMGKTGWMLVEVSK